MVKQLDAPQKKIESQRINFLFQASHILNEINQPELSRIYAFNVKKINQKLIIKNQLKHEICSNCCSLLKFSSKTKLKKNKLIITCKVCDKKKKVVIKN